MPNNTKNKPGVRKPV